MHWILQNNLFNEAAYQVLLETLERFDISHSIHKVIPFIGEITPEPGQLIPCKVNKFSSRMCDHETKCCDVDHKNVICMGSYSLRHAAKKHGWTPGVFDLEWAAFGIQHAHWGEHMLNHDSVMCTFNDAPEYFTEEEMFLRPIHDSKVFAGGVFNRQDFMDWWRKVVVLEFDYGNTLTKDTVIQVAPLKKIFSEHRFWVIKGKVATSSTYKIGRTVMYQSLAADSMFQKFAEERIAEWQPDEAFVIDICDTEDGLKIVEINTINSCGFYACDIQKLVMAFQEAFSKE